jgi:hypothetical protein
MSKIKSIVKKKIEKETLWNLAVEGDESYIANGFVVHNCRSLLIPITKYEEHKVDTKTNSGDDVNEFLKENVTDKGFSIYSMSDSEPLPEAYVPPKIGDDGVTFNLEMKEPLIEVTTYSLKGEAFQESTIEYVDDTKKKIKSIQHKRLDDDRTI